MILTLLVWVVLGLGLGLIANTAMRGGPNEGPELDMILGISGALVGGLLFRHFRTDAVPSAFDMMGLVVAGAAAAVVLLGWRAYRRASAT
jgi:uncharacterized membrane protein YeaQ/YmgE (transglycosylase-associated protein family)